MRARWLGILSALLSLGSLGAEVPVARDLTFGERVAAQEAIARVQYSHQIGATRPFEEAVPRVLLERQVRTYLAQSVALDELWKTPVTDAMLQRELERMSAGSRLPERLLELYQALGNDPFLIKECLARQILVNRLSRNFFAFDTRTHREARQEAEEIHAQLADGRLDPAADYRGRSTVQLSLGKPNPGTLQGSLGQVGAENTSHELPAEDFKKQRSHWPAGVGEASQVEEERDDFVIRVVLSETAKEMRGAAYHVPKTTWEAWWATVQNRVEHTRVRSVARVEGRAPVPALGPIRPSADEPTDGAPRPWSSAQTPCGPPDNSWDNGSLDDLPIQREKHTAVWTGSLMLVWGGQVGSSGSYLNSGGKYDPATDSWSPMSAANAPSARRWHEAVWTGSLMLVWGGGNSSGELNTGGRYDLATDTWSPISTTNAPSPRFGHTVIWSGSIMAVWGGRIGISNLNTGGRYDPASDTWASISTVSAPSARSFHTAVWTGSLMLVWGGSSLNTGGRYDPATDSWSVTSTANAPSGRSAHTAVWTGSLMLVWGGGDSSGNDINTGGRYDPASDIWTPTSTVNAPNGKDSHTAVWTGTLMLIWGGWEGGEFGGATNTGGRYDPAADLWSPISTTNAPSPRFDHTVVWSGSHMVAWGGGMGAVYSFDNGGRYDPTSDSWTPTSTTGAPSARSGHTAVWTGSLMVVWGGFLTSNPSSGSPYVNTGGRYDPATDSWTATSTTNAPVARYDHSAIWTGGRMVVWGGYINSFPFFVDTGGRYDAISDTWSPTSTMNAPSGRSTHTAIWTGSAMIVWGGYNGVNYLNSGGRYDPVADTWTPTSTLNAPSARWRHAAVWTGSRMLVWGGSAALTGGTPIFNTGGRYDPVADSWTPISTTNAPSSRYSHSAVWTGSRMVVWGGGDNSSSFNTGGRYDPAADTWTPTSTLNAPNGGAAVWTGSLMLVWGAGGGRYDPVADTWTPISTLNAPSGGGAAVWTGSMMVVWGGGSGGRYIVSDFPDLDGDGYAGCAECNDADALVWLPPLEVTHLALAGSGPTTVSWDSQGTLVGPGTAYDLVSGTLAIGTPSFASATCLQGQGSTSYSDTRTAPAPGLGYWYLSRGKNSCGAGTYGTGQRDAGISSCP